MYYNQFLWSFSDLFCEKVFKIPDFHRGYMWTEDHLRNFWGDLTNIEPGKVHYIGTIIVKAVDRSDVEDKDHWLLDRGYKCYHIIDGHQRIMTFLILLSEILRRFDDSEDILSKKKSFYIEKYTSLI